MSDLWLPSTATPKWTCDICGAEFTESERVLREQHVAKCVADHHDELVASYEQARPPGFFKSFDPEYQDWIKKHGRIG